MADANYRAIPGAIAAADLSASKYMAVRFSGTGRQVTTIGTATSERPIGILQDDPDVALEPADVAYDGVCKAELGGTVTVGNTLAVEDGGELIADVEVADGSAVDLHHIATALESGVDGDIIDVLLHTPIRIGLE